MVARDKAFATNTELTWTRAEVQCCNAAGQVVEVDIDKTGLAHKSRQFLLIWKALN
jgi:hypothetical protein